MNRFEFMDDWFQMHNLLNEQIPDDDEPADHDFDVISQSGCDYEENGKGLQLDVDKIIGSTQEEVYIYNSIKGNLIVSIFSHYSAILFYLSIFS